MPREPARVTYRADPAPNGVPSATVAGPHEERKTTPFAYTTGQFSSIFTKTQGFVGECGAEQAEEFRAT